MEESTAEEEPVAVEVSLEIIPESAEEPTAEEPAAEEVAGGGGAFFTFFFSFSFDLGSSAFAFGAAFDSSFFAFGAAFAASAGFPAFVAPADDGFVAFCSLLAESVFVFELLAGSLFVAKAVAFAAALSGGLGAIQSGAAAVRQHHRPGRKSSKKLFTISVLWVPTVAHCGLVCELTVNSHTRKRTRGNSTGTCKSSWCEDARVGATVGRFLYIVVAGT